MGCTRQHGVTAHPAIRSLPVHKKNEAQNSRGVASCLAKINIDGIISPVLDLEIHYLSLS